MKTSLATLALVLGLAVGLIGWFSTGYRAARSEDHARVSSLRQQTDARVADIAKQLREALRQLERVENSRPYYEFSNLFHDPRGAAQGLAVAPSPLANGPTDPLVRAYFQIARQPSGSWQVSMPTINDDLPKLGNASSADVALREDLTEVADKIVAAVTPVTPATPPVVAQVPSKRPRQQAPNADDAQAPPDNIAQQIQLTPNQYQQNANPNQTYVQAQQPLPWQGSSDGPQSAAPVPPSTAATSQLMVTVYAYEPKVLTVRGQPTLVALRRVVTPDGDITQGMALNRTTIAEWLAERAPGAELSTAGPTSADAHAALPWADNAWSIRLPYPNLAPTGDSRVTTFVRSFAPLALLVAACGALAIWVLVRTDRLARQQSRFAASAAHELRTPLAGLQLYGDMLADNLGDPTKVPTYARRVADEASRLGRVVSNMLGVSQLERGNIRVEPRIDDLASAVRDVVTALRPGIAANGASITLEGEDSLDARFDRDAVARIVGNLLDNAEKYSRAGGREITCTVMRSDNNLACVRISDQGPGVQVAERKLFRPFERGTRSDGPAGLGLGLALSRTLARAMGGDLTYRRNPSNTETIFELTLPVPA